jgi:uncharacterized protein YbjQ (UPF0145 family)
MPSIEKCLEMLKSSKADKRYEACEWLRVSQTSNEQIINALQNTLQDKESSVADAAKKALKADVHDEMLKKLGRPSQKSEEELHKTEAELYKEQESRAVSNVRVVSTPNMENYTIKEYLGFISSEVVLGTGFLSELEAEVADFAGVRSEKFQNKLIDANNSVLYELRLRAYNLHANAILSVDIDYSVIGKNMLMVNANGTAVIIEKIIG